MTKEPKDLGLKIGTKSEVLWTNVLKESEILIQQSKDNLEIQQEIKKLAETRIAEEKETLDYISKWIRPIVIIVVVSRFVWTSNKSFPFDLSNLIICSI